MSSPYFAHDKEQLLRALTRFDGDITVEDVTDGASQSYDATNYHTVLLQILLEAICKGFVKDEKQSETLLKEVCKQLSNFQILNPHLLMDKHNPLRIEIKQKFFNFVKQVLNDVLPEAEIDASVLSFLESINLSSNPDYCYHKCFEELKEIGRGGFGVVFKAKDKLTELIYAVKKIIFNYKNDAHFLKVMREAKNIAALDHPNVVRYNNAWIEVLPTNSDANQPTSNNNSVTFDDFDKNRSDDDDDDVSFCGEGVSAIVITENNSSACSDSSRTIETCTGLNSSDWNSDESSQSVIFANSADYLKNVSWTGSNKNRYTDEGTVDEASSSDSSDEAVESFKLNLNIRGVLYIQMEYCDCDLRFWLDERAKGNEPPFDMDIIEIFSDILNGLVHIHSKGIIHRDLKPQNIFYSKANNILKIGDFGLATLPGSSMNYLNDNCISRFHSANIGTLPYAAPEQIASKSYDSKVDIYSLGIILIELMNNFSTSMEFSTAITEVKSGKITKEMEKLPHLITLVRNLISKNPKNRMSAEEILTYCEEDTKGELKKTEKALKETKLELREAKLELREMKLELRKMTELLSEKEAIIHHKDEEIKRLQSIISDNFTDHDIVY